MQTLGTRSTTGSAAHRRLRRAVYALRTHLGRGDFHGSAAYWDRRYETGSDSGAGSYGRSAAFKAEFLNELVTAHAIESVVELGCGDGNQLSLARYPSYLGLDVSPTAVAACRARFAGDETKRFELLRDLAGEVAELALSLDVVFHLVEDEVFEAHMRALFAAASRYVVVYSTDTNLRTPFDRAHVRHRRVTDWTERMRDEWRLVQRQKRPGLDPLGRRAGFVVFGRA